MSKWYVTDCCMAPIQSGKCLKCGQDAKFKAMQFKLVERIHANKRDRFALLLNIAILLLSMYLSVILVKIYLASK